MLIRISRTFESLTLATVLALGLPCVAMAQQPTTTPSTPPVNRTEMDNFSDFLLNHPGVHKQLQQNPALINDPNYLAQHSQLQTFLNNHPGVAQQVKANPTTFMNDTNRFIMGGREITRAQAARTDQFLDSHPGIAQELRQNPNLIDDKQYLQQHPALQQYLQEHPGIREEWQNHPGVFERREAQYEKNNDLDITRAQAARADQFLDSHPEVAEELRKNPRLIDNKEWVAQHPQLKDFLEDHPEIRKEWK